MARITVEDCFKKLNNKFELAVLSSYRAKEISKGAAINIERNNDKNSVLALREIASEHVNVSNLRQAYIQSLQLHVQNKDVLGDDYSKSSGNSEVEIKENASPEELVERDFISLEEEDDSSIEEDLEIDASLDDISKKDS